MDLKGKEAGEQLANAFDFRQGGTGVAGAG
jgi:hypothetical protein